MRTFHGNQLRTLTQRPDELNAEAMPPVEQQPVGDLRQGFGAQGIGSTRACLGPRTEF